MRKKPRMPLATRYKVVKVEWTDAWSEDGWKEIKRLPENSGDARVTSLGWLVHEDEQFYYISNSISSNQVACTIVIPKSMVSSFEEIVLRQP